MAIVTAKPEHEVAYHELVLLMDRHAGHLSGAEMLAIAANLLGKLMALQDQRIMTPQRAIEIVRHNIELGNKQAIDQAHAAMAEPKGSA